MNKKRSFDTTTKLFSRISFLKEKVNKILPLDHLFVKIAESRKPKTAPDIIIVFPRYGGHEQNPLQARTLILCFTFFSPYFSYYHKSLKKRTLCREENPLLRCIPLFAVKAMTTSRELNIFLKNHIMNQQIQVFSMIQRTQTEVLFFVKINFLLSIRE